MTTTTDAINSVWNGATRIKDCQFNIQFPKMSSRIWKQHLIELPSHDYGNKNLNYFHKALNINLRTRDRIKNFPEDKYDVVACLDGEDKVQLIHSISNFGGTR